MLRQISSALVVVALAGCSRPQRTVESAFPVASQASPWILRDSVWSGPASEAATAIGDIWEKISPHDPVRAWLAVYQHETIANRALTVRGVRFSTRENARAAYEALRPEPATPFNMGEAGCWTDLGVLFVRGEIVFEVFGNGQEWEPAWQSVFLAGAIEKRLPPVASEGGS